MRVWGKVAVVAALTVSLAACGSGTSGSASNASDQAPGVRVGTGSASALPQGVRPDIEPPAGWQQAIDQMKPNGPGDRNAGLSVQVMGDCNSNNGAGMLLKVSGFPPNGSYLGQVSNPDGTRYAFFNGDGRFDRNGNASRWAWKCSFTNTGKADQPGVYSLEFGDVTEGSATKGVTLRTTFTVNKMA